MKPARLRKRKHVYQRGRRVNRWQNSLRLQYAVMLATFMVVAAVLVLSANA
ncbi:MAG: hypothetical protein AAGK14_00635 [Verrucomicrobiota bacterium]